MFAVPQDVGWFDKAVERIIMEELGMGKISNEPFFVDFLREAPEPTGDEPEDADLDAPKIYEQVCTSNCHGVYYGSDYP